MLIWLQKQFLEVGAATTSKMCKCNNVLYSLTYS